MESILIRKVVSFLHLPKKNSLHKLRGWFEQLTLLPSSGVCIGRLTVSKLLGTDSKALLCTKTSPDQRSSLSIVTPED